MSVEDALAAIGGEEPTDAREEDWNAVSGYRRAMTYVLQLAQDEHFEYTPQILRSLHFMMTEYTLDAESRAVAPWTDLDSQRRNWRHRLRGSTR